MLPLTDLGRVVQCLDEGKREGPYPLVTHSKCPSKGPEGMETIGLELPLKKLSSHSHRVKGKNHHRTQSYQPPSAQW